MLDLLSEWSGVLWWLAMASLVFFVGSLVLLPWAVTRIPADYFTRSQVPTSPWRRLHPVVFGALLVGKNIIGLVLLLAGIVMLVLPGQGLITIFLGLMLLDFPRRTELERYILSRGPVLRTINWMRVRRGAGKLDVPAVLER